MSHKQECFECERPLLDRWDVGVAGPLWCRESDNHDTALCMGCAGALNGGTSMAGECEGCTDLVTDSGHCVTCHEMLVYGREV